MFQLPMPRLYNVTINGLEKSSIPIENIIGYAADTANVMFGQHNSVMSQLRERIPNLFAMKCICHSAHLCASHACEKLPRCIEDMTRDIYAYFSHSAKRIAEFEKFQDFANVEPHKILKPAQTQWLSLNMCVSRILEQWDALLLFFTNAAEKDRLVAAENIANSLRNPFCHLYFQFLSFILPKFTEFNVLFQSETPLLHKLADELKSLYKCFPSCYMKRQYLQSQSLSLIDPCSREQMVPLTGMYLGHEVSCHLLQPEVKTKPAEMRVFLERCQNFLIESAIQIKAQYPLDDFIINSLSVLNPENINSHNPQYASLGPIASKFPNIVSPRDIQKLDDEWRRLQFTNLPFKYDSSEGIDRFWGMVATVKDGCDTPKFSLVASFMKSLLSFPHANADIEHSFQMLL